MPVSIWADTLNEYAHEKQGHNNDERSTDTRHRLLLGINRR
tara:strand:- start:3111 stop:3233 length:123 start_codon:yes stop_codon:yes gene_type:complete